MKLLLVSDIHLGVKRDSELFIYNTRDFFLKQINEEIKNSSIDQLWILGDLFDSPIETNTLVSNVAMNIMATLIKTYPHLQIKLLCGNHDAYYKKTLQVNSINIFKRFHKNLEVITEIKEFDLDGYKTLVVPWLIKEGKMWNEFISTCNNYSETQVKKYNLCLGHFEINGFEIIKGVVEKGGLKDEFFQAFDYVFSGHFHIRNKIKNIQYLGCPYEITWNDFGDPKGFTTFDTKTQQTVFFQNKISPKHKKIILSSVLMSEDIIKDVAGNFIKFIIDKPLTTDEQIEWSRKIEAENPLRYEVINDYENNLELPEDVQISSIEGDALSMLNEYNSQLEYPPGVTSDELSLYMKKLHDQSMLDDN